MSYYSNGTSALKLHINDINRKNEIEIDKKRQEQLRKVYRKRMKQRVLRTEVVLSVLLSFVVFAAIVYGYISPTALRIEVSQLEQELHEIKGIRNDRIAEVESLKASQDVIKTAQHVLGMNFASEESYVHIDASTIAKEEPAETNMIKQAIEKIENLALISMK